MEPPRQWMVHSRSCCCTTARRSASQPWGFLQHASRGQSVLEACCCCRHHGQPCSARAGAAGVVQRFGPPQTRDATGLAPAQGEGTLGTHRSFLNRGPPSPSIFVLVAEVLPDLPPINARLRRTPPTTRAQPTTISAPLSGPVRDQEPGPSRCSNISSAINYSCVPSSCSSSVAH